MQTLEEIKVTIKRLSLSDRGRLERWLHGWEDDAWDQQVIADTSGGKLNALLRDIDNEIDAGDTRELP